LVHAFPCYICICSVGQEIPGCYRIWWFINVFTKVLDCIISSTMIPVLSSPMVIHVPFIILWRTDQLLGNARNTHVANNTEGVFSVVRARTVAVLNTFSSPRWRQTIERLSFSAVVRAKWLNNNKRGVFYVISILTRGTRFLWCPTRVYTTAGWLTNDRPVLSSERAPSEGQDSICQTIINIWS
jgi:hypothetical protein